MPDYNQLSKYEPPVVSRVYASNGATLDVSTDGISTPITLDTNVFIVNKGPSIIGLKTAIAGEELFFHTNGSDDDRY